MGVRVQTKRLLKLGKSFVMATEVGQNAPSGTVGLGQGRVERERLFGGRQARLVRLPSDAQRRLANGYQGPGAGILGIDLQRALPKSNGDLQVLRAILQVIDAGPADRV